MEHIEAADEYRVAREISQSRMKRGAVFRGIDDGARHHRVAPGFDRGGFRNRDEALDNVDADILLRIIEEQVVHLDVKAGETIGIGLKSSADRPRQRLVAALGERR